MKPAIRFRGNHFVGMAVNQDQPCPAKTILTPMVNPIFGASAFVARLLPVLNLTTQFLFEELQIIINKRASLACAARLADTLCPPEAPFGHIG